MGILSRFNVKANTNYVIHRDIGDIPDCIAAPHDPSWLDVHDIPERSCAGLYCDSIASYLAGNMSHDQLRSNMSVR